MVPHWRRPPCDSIVPPAIDAPASTPERCQILTHVVPYKRCTLLQPRGVTLLSPQPPTPGYPPTHSPYLTPLETLYLDRTVYSIHHYRFLRPSSPAEQRGFTASHRALSSLRRYNRALLYSQWDPHLHTDIKLNAGL